MDPDRPSLLSRAIAIAVLIVVAVIALRLALGFIGGLLSMLVWLAVLVAVLAAGYWAWSTLRRGKPRPVAKGPVRAVSRPDEDPFDAEMRKLTEQLREQGRI